MGPKVTTLVLLRGRCAHICVGFVDVTRIRRESGAYVKCYAQKRHVAGVSCKLQYIVEIKKWKYGTVAMGNQLNTYKISLKATHGHDKRIVSQYK
jgi:hypothetical protein